MNENIKRKIIGISLLVLGFILILLIIFLLFFNKKDNNIIVKDPVNVNPPEPVKIINTVKPVETVKTPSKITTGEVQEESDEKKVERIAVMFAEKFGSYSNQSSYSNFESLKSLSSSDMIVWIDKYVEKFKTLERSDYEGIITKAVYKEVIMFNENKDAIVLVKTRRRSAKTEVDNTSDDYNQEIVINFIMANGEWKVDGALWQ